MAENEDDVQAVQPPDISGQEFRELGYLQEVNRRVLHPLGLALFNRPGWTREEVQEFLSSKGVQFGDDAVDCIMTFLSRAGMMEEHIAGVLDDRQGAEGWRFAVRQDHLEEDMAEFTRKRINVESEWLSRSLARIHELGYIVQDEIHVPSFEPNEVVPMSIDEEIIALGGVENPEDGSDPGDEEYGDVEGYT
jgi:hypothetical protein